MVIPQRGGLPHSDIHGSTPARGSPWLFAACHVFHRLLVPRHPPNALLMLESTGRIPKNASKPSCTGTIHTPFPRSRGPTRHVIPDTTHFELSLHTRDQPASRPASHRNASERSCHRSLGGTPRKRPLPVRLRDPHLATARQHDERVPPKSRSAPPNGAPRDAPEPDLQFQRTTPKRPN